MGIAGPHRSPTQADRLPRLPEQATRLKRDSLTLPLTIRQREIPAFHIAPRHNAIPSHGQRLGLVHNQNLCSIHSNADLATADADDHRDPGASLDLDRRTPPFHASTGPVGTREDHIL